MVLKRSVERDMIITAQRRLCRRFSCILSNIEYRFHSFPRYGRFEDKRTVYEGLHLSI